ncbi:MAG TPA: PDZ domain-containing protein [Candidatus Polarisedimenticolia bacterium]|nr:PDZ domain-containing protein [Candidatus Polarisedimenticolia bacterium]
MDFLRYVKGAALVAMVSTAVAFAGVPPKEPAKPIPPKDAGKEASRGSKSGYKSSSEKVSSDKSSEKKCPYTTQECLNYMAARLKASGWIGIEYEPEEGNEITRVVVGSPAEKAGLVPGDRLYALNGVEIRKENQEALEKARKEWAPGQTVHYTVTRNGLPRSVDIVLAPWPADVLARYIGEHMLQHAEADAAALHSPK